MSTRAFLAFVLRFPRLRRLVRQFNGPTGLILTGRSRLLAASSDEGLRDSAEDTHVGRKRGRSCKRRVSALLRPPAIQLDKKAKTE